MNGDEDLRCFDASGNVCRYADLSGQTERKTAQFDQEPHPSYSLCPLNAAISGLRQEASFYSSVVESQHELICRHSADGVLTFVNGAYCKYFGKTREELVGSRFRPFIPEDDMRRINYHLSSLGPGTHTVSYEHRILVPNRDDKEVRWLQWTAGAIFDASGRISEVQTVGRDITGEKLLEERLRDHESRLDHLTHHDPLTGLPNRTHFSGRLQEELLRCRRYGRKVAVILLDLDNFKKINDSLGHELGDLLLKEVAHRIKECLRGIDVLSRLGGDEFTVMLPELEKIEGAGTVAQKIIDDVSRPFRIGQHELYVTITAGIAVYPLDGGDVDNLVKNADTAMYDAKSKDKNNYQFFNERMNTATVERLAMESSLRKGIENREFVLYYQPQISIYTGRIIGAEALIRWMHPTKGMVPPVQFIPIAEETGLIVPLSEWVIQTACEQNKDWQDRGLPPITMAVNISMKHFRQPNLIDVITDALGRTKLAPEHFELEMTESIIMYNVDTVVSTLRKFRDTGLNISIDDFGTGYSSLNYLKRLPITKLKIDQTFVRNITADKNDAMIVKTVIEMAHNLGLKVIAEGVETSDHVNFLRILACDELQGYFFSKPLPSADFIKLWETMRIIM